MYMCTCAYVCMLHIYDMSLTQVFTLPLAKRPTLSPFTKKEVRSGGLLATISYAYKY